MSDELRARYEAYCFACEMFGIGDPLPFDEFAANEESDKQESEA